MSLDFSTVVGLGNPGSRYDSTRHNIGFAVVDALRASNGLREPEDVELECRKNAAAAIAGDLARVGWNTRDDLHESTFSCADWSASLVKPMSFMNRSGEPLQRFLHYKKITISQVIVVHDEIDIPFGSIRIKVDGGEGGHNGLRSISDLCGGRGYTRVRVGVGKPAPGSPLATHPDGVATWVLGKFTSEEQQFAQELVSKAAAAVALLGLKGLRAAQNRFNG